MLFDNSEKIFCAVFKVIAAVIDINRIIRLLERCNFSVAVLIVAFFDVLSNIVIISFFAFFDHFLIASVRSLLNRGREKNFNVGIR